MFSWKDNTPWAHENVLVLIHIQVTVFYFFWFIYLSILLTSNCNSKRRASNWTLTSCPLHRISSGQSNFAIRKYTLQKSSCIILSKPFLKSDLQNQSTQKYKSEHNAHVHTSKTNVGRFSPSNIASRGKTKTRIEAQIKTKTKQKSSYTHKTEQQLLLLESL